MSRFEKKNVRLDLRMNNVSGNVSHLKTFRLDKIFIP